MAVGRATSKLIHMVVGKIQFLKGYGTEGLNSWPPQNLGIGQLTTWYLDSLRGREQERT